MNRISSEQSKRYVECFMKYFKIASWNVRSLRGSTGEIVETLSRITLINLLAKTWMEGLFSRLITDKDSVYKAFWIDSDKDNGGVLIFPQSKWIEIVCKVTRVSDVTIMVKLMIRNITLCVLCVYTPQRGLSVLEKSQLFDTTFANVSIGCIFIYHADFINNVCQVTAG